MSFAENAIEGVGASEEVPPGEVGQPLAAELESGDLFLVLLFFFASHNDFSSLFGFVDEISDEAMFWRSKNFSHAGFHSADESGVVFVVIDFEDEFLFDWIEIEFTFEKEVDEDGFGVVRVEVIPINLGFEEGFFGSVEFNEFHY